MNETKIDFTSMVPQVELFSFVFWENWRLTLNLSQLYAYIEDFETGWTWKFWALNSTIQTPEKGVDHWLNSISN